MDISVITPFYKGNAYMQQLLDVMRRNAQNAKELSVELVLVNDSPDVPILYDPDWVQDFSLQIVENPHNMGIQRTRINGLGHAQGQFVIFLDQDDLLSDDALLSQWQHIGDCDVVVGNGYNENRDSKNPIYQSLTIQKQVSNPRFYLSVGCLIVSPGHCMLRREAIPEIWKKQTIACNGADDYLLWLMMMYTGSRWAVNPDIVYTHVDTGENLSANLEHMLKSSCEALDILKQLGMLTQRQDKIARRRFGMRRMYEGCPIWRKAVACALYPDLFWELLVYTGMKKLCK